MKPAAYGPFPYSPISRRPPYTFPNGARIAVWLIPNLEFFALSDAIPVAAGGGGKAPDIPGWSVRDYGNRIGVFRMIDVMQRYGARGTAALNSDLCLHHPEIIDACVALDWEFMGHNETNSIRLNAVPDGEDGAIVQRTVAAITRAVGVAPKGWLGSGLQETWNTLDHLADAGVQYVADWCNDDQPYVMTLQDGRTIASIPYSTELNDKGSYERRFLSPDDFCAMICRQFDVLWREGETQARVMAIALHPYLSGIPHRIGALDRALEHICRHDGVWLATGAEIAGCARTL